LSGDVGHNNFPSVSFDADFSDIWDHLDFAAMVTDEARYERFSVFGEILYTISFRPPPIRREGSLSRASTCRLKPSPVFSA
jgi:hypothetical protein